MNLLTVAIPTYNRAAFLNKQLGLLCQLLKEGNEFDILVSDNASTDNTSEIVDNWKKIISNLTYYRHENNVGMDGNFTACYELFRTKYCWLLGDTRIISSQEMVTLLNYLEKDYDAYIFTTTPKMILDTKVYTDIEELLNEQGWHITNMSATIVTKAFVNKHTLNRFMGSVMVHYGNFIETLCNMDSFRIQFVSKEEIFIREFKVLNESKRKTGWTSHSISIFGRNWYHVVMSLSYQIPLELKYKVMKDHNRFTEAVSIRQFKYYFRLHDSEFKKDALENIQYLRFVSDEPYWKYRLVIACSWYYNCMGYLKDYVKKVIQKH